MFNPPWFITVNRSDEKPNNGKKRENLFSCLLMAVSLALTCVGGGDAPCLAFFKHARAPTAQNIYLIRLGGPSGSW